MTPQHRDYQEKARREIHETEHRRVLCVAPTGSGKTVVGCTVIVDDLRAGKRCLWLAPRRELVNQTVGQLKELGVPDHDIGVIMADDERVNPGARVQVASIATMHTRGLRPDADRVVLDEAHHAAAKTVAVICAHYNEANILGLTATPFRTGKLQLGEYFNGIVYGPMPSELIKDRWLMKPSCYAPPDSELPDLKKVQRDQESGDFQIEQLERAVNKRELVGSIVGHWKKLANGRRTIAFAVNINHARSICAEFLAAGIPAEVLIGTTSKLERDLMFARLKAGVTRILVTVSVLTEGWDAPWVKCAIIARPTCSLVLHIQMAGRILRPWGWGGVAPIILDHAGNTNWFDVPHVDRKMSLTETMPKRGKGAGKAVVRNPVTGELLSVVAGELQEIESIPVQTHCLSCAALLSMTRASVRHRRGRTDVLCVRCNARKKLAALTPEARRRGSLKAARKRTPEQRSEYNRRRYARLTPEQRREEAAKLIAARAALSHEQRSALAVAAWTPDRREKAALTTVKKETTAKQSARKSGYWKGLTQEQRSAIAHKGHQTRKEKSS